ncbi:MAG: DNA polymerase III subunit delta [Actinomycetota bacterium]|nr:DNA polymerase III subunit delta [Actinomycetota bacterium]
MTPRQAGTRRSGASPSGAPSTPRGGGDASLRPDAPVYLVRGGDPPLVDQSLRSLVERLVGDDDPALVVEEHGANTGEDLDIDAVLDALATPAFLAARRIVVVRGAGRIDAQGARRIVEHLGEPATTVLVLAAGSGTIPRPLVAKVDAVGAVVDAEAGTGGRRRQWLAERLSSAPVHLSADAASLVDKHLGGDLARLEGLVAILASAYGQGARLGAPEVAPFLGGAGEVAPWVLTDAVDKGETAAAVAFAARMVDAGGMHALQVIAILHRHFESMLRLDGLTIAGAQEAAEALGVRSAFVAGKALEQSRRLGSDRVAQAITLLARADLDCKGASALAPDVVIEVLVARLSQLVRSAPSSAARRRGR